VRSSPRVMHMNWRCLFGFHQWAPYYRQEFVETVRAVTQEWWQLHYCKKCHKYTEKFSPRMKIGENNQ
jgi:hypothetical protein